MTECRMKSSLLVQKALQNLKYKTVVKLCWNRGRSSFSQLEKINLTCTSNIQNTAADGVARRQKAKNKSMNAL